MREHRPFFAVEACIVAALFIAACSQSQLPPAAQKAVQQIESSSTARQQAVDAAINGAQAAVGQLAAAAGGLESRVKGLQIKSDLQQIQRNLNSAIGQSADKKTEAVQSASNAFSGVITKLENAASQAPAGSKLQADLNAFANQLKTVQSQLGAAIGSGTQPSAPSSATTP